MRRIIGLVGLLVVSGCADPESSRLEPGDVVTVGSDLGITLHEASLADAYPQLEPGVRLRVESDPGFFQESNEDIARLKSYRDVESRNRVKAGPQRYEEGHPLAKFRKVRVTVLDGDHARATGSVFRYAVVPAR